MRNAILKGTSAAATAHHALGLRARHAPHGEAIDVFRVIDDLGLPLLFRPLEGLLGACVKVSPGRIGIMITTQRDLHLQRFTAAHELGHFLLEHEGSLDREVFYPGQGRAQNSQELEANAFAGEFLMPKWLCTAVAKRGNWSKEQLQEPDVVYQMSLRMGVSYEAACWGLEAQSLIPKDVAARLTKEAPKKSKARALNGLSLANSRSDVWLLTERDHDASLFAGPGDLLILNLPEHTGSGYLWDLSVAQQAGFKVVSDERKNGDPALIGSHAVRRIALSPPDSGGRHLLGLTQRRPWLPSADPLSTYSVRICTTGSEQEGLYQSSPDPSAAFAQ